MTSDSRNDTRNARNAILSKIKRTLEQHPERNPQSVTDRLRTHPSSPIPERSRVQGDALIDMFCAMLEKAGATHESLDHVQAIPERIADWLKRQNSPATIRVAEDPLLQEVDCGNALEVAFGAPDENDTTTLTRAFAGIAETGTLIMVSGETSPTTANFLPENHIVVLEKRRIFGAYEEIWDGLRHDMPRTVNMITGPSRTGDIEQTILMGAHGPKRLHVFIID